MKIILHNGMPKSGTTALQDTLFANRDFLAGNGILYPAGGDLPQNHNILCVGVLPKERLPRLFQQIYKNESDKRFDDFQAVIDQIAALAKKGNYHTVILSSEMLFRGLSKPDAAKLRQSLLTIGEYIHVVTYIRHPADYYLSIAQQTLKASSVVQVPKAPRYKPVIESYQTVADKVTIAPYDREQLHGSDITRDFFHRLLPDHTSLVDEMKLLASNETVSAEGMDILQRYRKNACAQKNQEFTPDTRVILKHLFSLDRKIEGFSRPILLPPVHDAVVRSAIDLPWLRANYGLEFSGIDYSAGFADADKVEPQTIADICELDESRRDKLLMMLMRRLALAAVKSKEMSFKSALRM